MKNFLLFAILCLCRLLPANAEECPPTFSNPILPGFNPDPSICRVGDDYYLVTSSFVCYPGLPIYHSKDLVNWELIGYALNRPGMVNFENVNDNHGIWAPTLRYHDGIYYLITTAYKCGGNFYMTATDPHGPWSDPVWLENIPYIDPSLFWDDDGKCYYISNGKKGKNPWPAQCGIWIQEIDLAAKKLVGTPSILTFGHASNAQYGEGPHLYKIDGQYLLLMAEGGSGKHHAITAHYSSTLFGPYVADPINPVLTSRHMGSGYTLQNLGHADLVQTPQGEWWAVFLGNRHVNGGCPMGRETFLCPVTFEKRSPIFNAGKGCNLYNLSRPDLPWTPFKEMKPRDEFETADIDPRWHYVRIPHTGFLSQRNGKLALTVQPESVDSLTCAAMLVQRVKHLSYSATTKMDFHTRKKNEQAGIILYRTADGYYALLKGRSGLQLIAKENGIKKVISEIPYKENTVYLSIEASGMTATFHYGTSPESLRQIGDTLRLQGIADSKINKFNGTVIGIYGTGNGETSSGKAFFDWFEYIGHP